MLLAIFAAVFVNNLIGALWYNHFTFRKVKYSIRYTPFMFLYYVMDKKQAGKCHGMGPRHIIVVKLRYFVSGFIAYI